VGSERIQVRRRLAKRQLVLDFEETSPIFSLSSLTVIDCKAGRTAGFYKFLARLDEILTEG
jgi:hypothetical protein